MELERARWEAQHPDQDFDEMVDNELNDYMLEDREEN